MRRYPENFIEKIKENLGSKKYQLDYLNKGRLACAMFVSSVLFDFGLIAEKHAIVRVVVHNLRLFGWKKVGLEDVEPGDIIIWEKNKSGHYHIGFYVGDNSAISNSWKERVPVKHDIEFTNEKLKKCKRKIVKVLALLKEE